MTLISTFAALHALRGRRHPRLRTWDKLFWLGVRRLHRDWRRHLFLVRPETVLRWHRQGWHLFWRWRSGRALGRPRVNPEVRVLIATMAGQNPHCGTERIRGELLKAWHLRQRTLHPPLPTPRTCPTAQPELAHLPHQSRSGHLGR